MSEPTVLGGVLGILRDNPETYLRGENSNAGLTAIRIQALIDRRVAARKAKDWGTANRIRDELQTAGILLEDGADGTIWRRG